MEKFEKRETRPLEKYIGRLAKLGDDELKPMRYGRDELSAAGCSRNEFGVAGYSRKDLEDEGFLIMDAPKSGGRLEQEPFGFVSKECKYYRYVNINDLKTKDYGKVFKSSSRDVFAV